MIGQEDGMFTMPFRKREREHSAFLNETQRTLINEKFEIFQQSSFGFTQDRLLLALLLFHVLTAHERRGGRRTVRI
jgi:hypothetical protein